MAYQHNLTTYYCTEMDTAAETFVKSTAVLIVQDWGIRSDRTRMGIAARKV